MQKPKLIVTLASSAMLAIGIGTVHAQQGKSGASPNSAADKTGVYSATPIHSESMAALDRAAQRLRESIQALAQKKQGPERNTAIESAKRALIDTQQAMIALPPEYRVEGLVVSNKPFVKVDPAQNRTSGDSLKELQTAADRLRTSIQSMAQRPAGEARNDAIRQAHQALSQTQEAMARVLSGTTTASSGGSASGKAGVIQVAPVYTESMSALDRAAQRLRESIQSLAQKQPGAERETAITAAKKALLDTQQAMVALPPEYRVEGIVLSDKPLVKGNSAQNRTFGDSLKELQLASNRLRDAIQAMAQRAPGQGRNDAIKEAHQAFFQTQQAMAMVPGTPSTASSGGS